MDVEKLYVEDKGLVGLNAAVGCAVGTVGKVAGHYKSSLATFAEKHEAFAEAGYYALKVECGGAAAIGAVEYLTVDVLAGIVYNYSGVGCGSRILALHLDEIGEAVVGSLGVGILGLELSYIFLAGLYIVVSLCSF